MKVRDEDRALDRYNARAAAASADARRYGVRRALSVRGYVLSETSAGALLVEDEHGVAVAIVRVL